MLVPAKLLKVILAVSVLVLASKEIRGQTTTPLTVTVTNSPGLAISNDFIGLGFEISQQLPNVNGVSGNLFSPTNSQLLTLLQNMNIRSIRIGGGSAEWANGAHLAHSDIDSLFGFARVARVKVIYALQLENGTTNYDDSTARRKRPTATELELRNPPNFDEYCRPIQRRI